MEHDGLVGDVCKKEVRRWTGSVPCDFSVVGFISASVGWAQGDFGITPGRVGTSERPFERGVGGEVINA